VQRLDYQAFLVRDNLLSKELKTKDLGAGEEVDSPCIVASCQSSLRRGSEPAGVISLLPAWTMRSPRQQERRAPPPWLDSSESIDGGSFAN
jgi:hypothetical protein